VAQRRRAEEPLVLTGEVRGVVVAHATAGTRGVAHDVQLPVDELFFAEVHLLGGPAPVRRFLPELIDLIYTRRINPGKVFDLALPLEQVEEGYRAMDERRAIKVLLTL
jgi:threonine dehydrogenase-like Zn-dependent dehydrogenase